MSLNKVLTSLVVVLMITASGFAQEKKPKGNIKIGDLEITPEMIEYAERQTERLRHPSFIKVELVPVSHCAKEEAQKGLNCFTAHSKIELKVLMTNLSSEPISIGIDGSYYWHNLQLFRDGQLVPYLEGVAEIADKPPSAFYRRFKVKLEPGKTTAADRVYLDEWYKPLEAGHYQLDVKRRFTVDGGWADVASLTFDIDPQ